MRAAVSVTLRWMPRLRAAQIAVRTVWVLGWVLRAGGVTWAPKTMVILALVGLDLMLAYVRDRGAFRPSLSEIALPVLGVLAMAALMVLAIVPALHRGTRRQRMSLYPRPGRERYYSRDLGPSRWLFVVVHFNETPARIVTAYANRKDPPGLTT